MLADLIFSSRKFILRLHLISPLVFFLSFFLSLFLFLTRSLCLPLSHSSHTRSLPFTPRYLSCFYSFLHNLSLLLTHSLTFSLSYSLCFFLSFLHFPLHLSVFFFFFIISVQHTHTLSLSFFLSLFLFLSLPFSICPCFFTPFSSDQRV